MEINIAIQTVKIFICLLSKKLDQRNGSILEIANKSWNLSLENKHRNKKIRIPKLLYFTSFLYVTIISTLRIIHVITIN